MPRPQQPRYVFPPRPERRSSSSYAATLCFWTVFLLFVAGLVFIGVLATSSAGQWQPFMTVNGHIAFGRLLVGFGIAALLAVIASYHHLR